MTVDVSVYTVEAFEKLAKKRREGFRERDA
jgi:hypothetical protein